MASPRPTPRSIVRWSDPPAARVRVLCIPHAGAGAGRFRDWLGLFPADLALWAVRLPGRESRALEPPLDRLDRVLEALLAELRDVSADTLALYGHCSGAIVAFALARELARRDAKPVRHLFVAGQVGPTAPERPEDAAAEPSAIELAQEHLGRGQLDDAFVELLAAAIEGDRSAVDDFVPDGAPIDAPITAFVGADDPVRRDDVAAWADATTAAFASAELPGDHLLDASWPELARRVAQTLGR